MVLLVVLVAAVLFLLRDSELLRLFSHGNFEDNLAALDAFKAYVNDLEPWGKLSFLFIQFLQVVVFILPGEIPQIAGGYLFGWFQGFILSSLGIAIGSVFNFYVGRLWGKGILRLISGEKGLEETEKLFSSPKVMLTGFLLFLIPGIPKDAVCYIAGFSKIPLYQFILFSTIGRLPGVLGSAIIGGTAAERNSVFSLALLGVSTLLFLLGLLFRKKILDYLEKTIK